MLPFYWDEQISLVRLANIKKIFLKDSNNGLEKRRSRGQPLRLLQALNGISTLEELEIQLLGLTDKEALFLFDRDNFIQLRAISFVSYEHFQITTFVSILACLVYKHRLNKLTYCSYLKNREFKEYKEKAQIVFRNQRIDSISLHLAGQCLSRNNL